MNNIKDLEQLTSMQLYHLTSNIVDILKARESAQNVIRIASKSKTANEQRAELIQQAREFVEEMTTKNHPDRKAWFIDDGFYEKSHIAEFIINAKKRTVVVLIKNSLGTVRLKGIAKCMPGDVFNEWIGKAIALAKALEVEIPQEFLQAVQPRHYAIGQLVKRHDANLKEHYEVMRIGSGKTLKIKWGQGGGASCTTTLPLNHDDGNIRALQVIDDTNAQYEVTP